MANNPPNQPQQAPPNQAGQPMMSHDAMRAHLAGAGAPEAVTNELLARGFDFSKILQLIQLVQQYGPQAWQLVQTIIDLFKTPGAPPNVAGQPASPK